MLLKKASKVETIGNANLLATTVSDNGLWPDINYANLEAVDNVKWQQSCAVQLK